MTPNKLLTTFLVLFISPCSFNQLRRGNPVWAGYPRGLGSGLDCRKHLLGGKQPGSDRGGQAGRHHEDHAAGWGGGAPSSYCPGSPGWVTSTLLTAHLQQRINVLVIVGLLY